MATSARQSSDGRAGPLKDTRTQLFVGNLPYRVRWQDLKDLFRRAGTVLRADVSLGPDNRSRGYGTVLLATAEDAGRAIDMFHGYSWQTRILEVRPDRLPPDFDNPLAAPALIPALPPQSFPTSSSVTLPSPLTSATHITSPSRSVRALSDDLDYNSIFASDSSNAASSVCRNLFLPFHCQWQDLKDLFRQAGTIIRADVALGPDGRSRGFGTVVFATEQDAERAVKMLNG
ncbi:RNA-binding domain-containing protein [Macrolepiota fuliginosa MF-IS2]|uniref:RNA-binding domain-containing protein n=1 Tax=Macrolepiota fuliginosa MF-IS2 TaxID=1400762 RepID=A0A9P5XBF5_9AGAR|nr:RNA-binding domain-containing protein [Macrolepiota fuliginosa MF-IS2]